MFDRSSTTVTFCGQFGGPEGGIRTRDVPKLKALSTLVPSMNGAMCMWTAMPPCQQSPGPPAKFPYAYDVLSAKYNFAHSFEVEVEDAEGLTDTEPTELTIQLPAPGAEKCLFSDIGAQTSVISGLASSGPVGSSGTSPGTITASPVVC